MPTLDNLGCWDEMQGKVSWVPQKQRQGVMAVMLPTLQPTVCCSMHLQYVLLMMAQEFSWVDHNHMHTDGLQR